MTMTVKLSALVSDGTNFKDTVFKRCVHHFMQRSMPSIPLGMLDTESEDASTRWQIETPEHHYVREAKWTAWTCSACGDQYTDEPEVCCYDDEDENCPIEKSTESAYVVVNEHTGVCLSSLSDYVQHGDIYFEREDVVYEGETDAWGWEDEGDAWAAAQEADEAYESEHGHEHRYGFPWAHGTVFIPDPYISDAALKGAGFVVASYIGGDGDDRRNDSYRLAGIDGGGYSFMGAHFATLVALHHEERQMKVETAHGDVFITTDERADLEVLAQDGQKAAS